MEKDLKPNLMTRISAAVLDILFVTLLSSFVINPLLNSNEGYTNLYNEYETRLLNTKLVEKTSDNGLQSVIASYEETKVEEYENNLISFYTSYQNEDNDYVQAYIDTKKNYPEAFTYNEESLEYTFTENGDAIKSFYTDSYNNAITFFQTNDAEFSKVLVKLQTILTICDYSAIGVSLIIFFLVIPLCLKGRKTIGKKLFKLEVYSVSTKQELNRGMYVLRFLVYALTIYGSLIFNGLPLLASLACVLFTKRNISIHDFLIKSEVIDTLKIDSLQTVQTNSEVLEVEATIKNEDASDEGEKSIDANE